jgi:NAD(P)-dependent dehydrogenase (short-subunit alcohol dehydrogenase family)
MKLEDQVVVITGAGQGIGFGIAQAFARAGSAVVVNDVNTKTAHQAAASITADGGRALAAPADISKREEIATIYQAAQAAFGKITTLINNAGWFDFTSFMEQSPEAWQRTLDIDLSGIFHCTQLAVPYMLEAGGGSIVNITSVHASATIPGTAAYAAAKAGIVGMTRTLALEFGKDNIRVNCVSPGAINTAALEKYFNSLPLDQREKEQAHMLGFQALPFFGTAEDVAELVCFVCSERARYITGTELVIDGGVLARLF